MFLWPLLCHRIFTHLHPASPVTEVETEFEAQRTPMVDGATTALRLPFWHFSKLKRRPLRSVRYVYQPMESLNLVVITNKASNILEDRPRLFLLRKQPILGRVSMKDLHR